MKGFAIKDCKSEYVIDIKNQYKKFANKQEVRNAYTKLLNETNIALDNIKEILDNQEECEKLLSSLRQCDTSFLDSVIGTFEHGQNGSYYRAYLALDEKSVVEIRIANHYETKGVILDKSNNKSQYLYQIVLVTNPPIQQSDDSIRGSANVANVKVLTKGLIGDNATDDDIKKLLTSIYDYLIQPNNSFDNAIYSQETNENKKMNKKQVIRLTESQFHQIVKETVKRVLKEEVDMGQVPSSYDKTVRRQNRDSFENRPEIIAARRELHRLRNSIEDVEAEGGDITPIRQKIRNINNRYFDGNYIWHLQRGDKWVDFKGWFDTDGNPASGNEELEWV